MCNDKGDLKGFLTNYIYKIYLWKMAMKVGMYSATQESVTVARGQR